MKTTRIACGCIAVLLAGPRAFGGGEHPDAKTRPRAAHQRPEGLRLPSDASVPVPHSNDRPATDPICRPAAARVSEAGPGHRHPCRRAPPRGEYLVVLQAENQYGRAERRLKIVSGDMLALTPPMGWNHWYAHYTHITDPLIRQAAETMAASGMADVGYQYVSIDGCWQNASPNASQNDDPLRVGTPRDAKGDILPNRYFPNMRALTDCIQIGYIGSAQVQGRPKPCPLTPTEQCAFMSLWCLMASPLFFSGDMGKLDEFTINVLSNPEVIEIDQDPLGQCAARVVRLSDDTFLMVKDLEDHSKAVGLCNRGQAPQRIMAKWLGPRRGGEASRSRSLASKGPWRFSAWVFLAR